MTYNQLKVNDKGTEEIIDRDRGKEKKHGGREGDDREDGERGKEKIGRKGG